MWLHDIDWMRQTWTDNVHFLLRECVSFGDISNELYSTHASAHGQLQTLQHLTELGYNWDFDTYKNAAKNGHLELLKWMHDGDGSVAMFPLNNINICKAAASGGQNNVLQWYKEEMDIQRGLWQIVDYVFIEAVKNGHVHTMQWLKENGCRWDEMDALTEASETDNIDTIQWLEANRSPQRMFGY
jgi:hypothetical protein